ncbi:DUF892 family protein [uncultured Methylobacterium sp.]|uniref:DUF892 family protein n=1 Tax=uncultured Methylobacterium sp. TaxID=157278 RepID=UPI0035CAF143
MSTSIKDIYATALRNTRGAELQGVHTMTTVLKGLENYPAYERVTRQHLDTTHGQIVRLDAALKAIGETSSTIKDAVTSTVGLVAGAAHAVAGDETLKNLYAAYAYQHDQIAAYRSLVVIAEAAGQSAQVPDFKTTIAEEEAGAKALSDIIETVTKTYIQRATAGAKADS